MSTKPRAVLYVRLSRESAVSTSIQGQNADLYALAEREGWQIIRTFEDNGKSGGKARANAAAALAMLRDGEADVLAVYAYDRWSRMGIADSADLLRVVADRQARSRREGTPPPLFYAAREGIRSDQEGWEIRVAFAADIAQKERDRMVARRTAAIARMRQEGRNPGNGPAPFGYRSAPFTDGRPGRRLVPDPKEAGTIREVADRILEGETSTGVAKDLNARRVPMPRSPYRLAQLRGETPDASLDTGTWSSSRVSQLWASEHLLGRIMQRTDRHGERQAGQASRPSEQRSRDRYGEPVVDPATGLPLQAFEPILSVETMIALRERFSRNVGRGTQRQRRAARLLSGLTFCGTCGSPMYVLSTQRRYVYYRCSSSARGVECPGLSVKAEALESQVRDLYLRSFGGLAAVQYVEERGDAQLDEAIATTSSALRDVGAELADPEADVDSLIARRQQLVERLSELRRQAPPVVHRAVELGGTWAEVLAGVDDATWRPHLEAALDHVEVWRSSHSEPVRLVLRPVPDEYPNYVDADG
ncbi:hypothetical protein GRS96_12165 [Rathayibacter sp. VKM Ac-2803]|uniref:recombinase family protein n=1 Tax=Rathayibacter sp. VKM Ac-2803 TaxID=2609256 RepID=UPI00135CD69E|nr:recombinase family protein [Rathayibacter sp. VKM Ac-2803]MWV50024.1 hypothetical protein [Rathayibacter sp. VKM Ac-2803]